MGQKTHPYSFRLGVVTDWKSKWYSDRDYVNLVNEDWQIRDYLRGRLLRGAVSRIEVERTRDRVVVEIHTARPGVVIGRRGAEAERLRKGLENSPPSRSSSTSSRSRIPNWTLNSSRRGSPTSWKTVSPFAAP